MKLITKKITRVIDKEFCTLEVSLQTLSDGFQRFTICGIAGDVISRAAAKVSAKAFWVDFFDDNPEELRAMNEKCDTNFRSSIRAANYVLAQDGELHGLDVHEELEGKVYVTHSCGQIREDLKRFFPEVEEIFKWHLNDMHAGCEHQDAIGWHKGRDIALSKDELTPAQRTELERLAEAAAQKEREAGFGELLTEMRTSAAARRTVFYTIAPDASCMTVYDDDVLRFVADTGVSGVVSVANQTKKVLDQIREHVAKTFPAKPIESQVYKDCLGAPCPECGYRYGSAWTRRELPVEVLAWFELLPDGLRQKLSSRKRATWQPANLHVHFPPIAGLIAAYNVQLRAPVDSSPPV